MSHPPRLWVQYLNVPLYTTKLMAMAEPVLVGLIFADRVITENNNKRGIIGTFNRFFAESFPVVFPPWAIYAAVTNLTGTHNFSINLVDDESAHVIVAIGGEFGVERSIDVAEFPIMLGAVKFLHEGLYTLTFNVNGRQIGSRVLTVELKSQTGQS